MTANQINYAKLLEDIRAHHKSEEISSRQAGAAERQAQAAERQAGASEWQAEAAVQNAQTNAKNSLINESAVGAQWYGAQANADYQRAMASVSQQQALEAQRHNEQTERNTVLVEGWKAVNTQKQIETQERINTANIESNQLINDQKIRGELINTLLGTVGKAITNPSTWSAIGKVTSLIKGD